MRIAINCRSFLTTQYAGIGRYAYNLVQNLQAIDQRNEYLLYAKRRPFDQKRRLPQVSASNFHVRPDRFGRGLGKTLGTIDLYHSPSPDKLDIACNKIIVTVHDLVYKTYPQGHTSSALQETEKLFEELTQKAAKIICCSENTRADLYKYFPLSKDKTCVIHQGVDKNEFYPISKEEEELARQRIKSFGVDVPFLLFVGTLEPRKNLENLIRAFALLKSKKAFEGKLLCVGMKGWMSEGIFELTERLNLKNEVLFLGHLPNQDLRSLYNLAQAFVFPSFYEGFGFPLVEAFSCGAAVITSNVSSCPEVAEEAALKIDPYKSEDIADAIERVLGDQMLRGTLKEKALKRAQDFSFLKTAQETLKVYEEIGSLK